MHTRMTGLLCPVQATLGRKSQSQGLSSSDPSTLLLLTMLPHSQAQPGAQQVADPAGTESKYQQRRLALEYFIYQGIP